MVQKKYYPLLLAALFLLPLQAAAQSDSPKLEYRKWRITLFPPLSTNGIEAPNYTARYSINLVAGYHGGLDGGEIGGLVNYTKYYARGIQFAGLSNITGGDMEGIQIAGGANISGSDMAGFQIAGLANFSWRDMSGLHIAGGLNTAGTDLSGFQFAGLGNIALDDLEGVQAAGLFNASMNDLSGLQAAGILNFARNDLEGLQAAGIVQAAGGDISGLQASGIANFAGRDIEGLQAAGALNFAGGDISGLQAAGGANIAIGDIEGLLLSGGANIALEDASGFLVTGGINAARKMEGIAISGGANIANEMNGLQFAGLLNASEKAMGVQIGFINLAKEFEGVPVGFISLYGNGRKNLDVRYSETGFTDVGLTLGTYRVYNTAIFGYNTRLNRDVYRVGLGIGVEKNIREAFPNWKNESFFVNQEFTILHHFEEEWSRDLNLQYSYKYHLGKRFGNGFSIYGGPSVNMLVSRVPGSADYPLYNFWSPEWKGRDYQFWVGFTAGIRLFKQKKMGPLNISTYEINKYDDWEIDW